MSDRNILFGIDIFLAQSHLYKNYRIGLVANNAAVTSLGELSRVALLKAGFTITKLFSPEHGLTTKGADGSFQKNSIDPVTGLPVISLYGEKLKPSENDLTGLDIIVFDIPDVGARFYTYLWSLTCIMEACAESRKPLIILDRPNPLSGNLLLAEGPMLDEKNCSSFIGRWGIPIRHCCTYGELAKYFSVNKNFVLDLTVIKNETWDREKSVVGKDWRFTPTSPAITDTETALLYPGMGLMEGININEGRGTDTPFKVFGLPGLDAELLLKEFCSLGLPGINATTCSYIPNDSLYKKELCNGFRLSVTDADSFRPVLTGLELLRLIINLFPDSKERLYKTVANPTGKNHLDKLTGIFNSFHKIKNGEFLKQHYSTSNWQETIKPYLLY